MTVTAPQNETTVLIADFFDAPGGTEIDVSGLTITITQIQTGTVVVSGSAGITHVGTGAYTYSWAVSSSQALGDYLIEWSGTYNAATITASEVATVVSTEGVSTGPCTTWPVNWSLCQLTGVSPDVTGAAVAAATEVLWSLSGRRFGICQLTIRPCRRDCSGMDWGLLASGYVLGGWWQYGTYPRPLFFNGVWYNLTCGNGCADGACSCSYVSETFLPDPVADVVQVKVDGAVLDPSLYRVDDYRKLVRLGGGTWPLCNDLTKDDSQVGTWSVTVQFGEQVPTLGQLAVGELACQFARAMSNDEDCRLPKPVQQLVRQGVTLNFLDPNELFTHGKIGLYFCDLFISTFNPHGLTARSEVFDIDQSPYRITNTS